MQEAKTLLLWMARAQLQRTYYLVLGIEDIHKIKWLKGENAQ